MPRIRRILRCPACQARLHIATFNQESEEYIWSIDQATSIAWLNQHGHASRTPTFRHEEERWILGYRTDEPKVFETIDEEE